MKRMWSLGLFSFIAYVLIIAHSAIFRGRRITVSFFAFMVLASGLRRWLVHYVVTRRPGGRMPYEFLGDRIVDLGYVVPQEVVGWSLAIYLGWSLAELVMRKLDIGEDRVFGIIAWTYLSVGAMAHAVENAAHYGGWWRWNYHDGNVSFFNMPLAGYFDWAGMSFDILLVYFAILILIQRRWWAFSLICPILIQPFVYGANPAFARMIRRIWGGVSGMLDSRLPVWIAFNLLMIGLVLAAPFLLKTRLQGLRRPAPEVVWGVRTDRLDAWLVWIASGIILAVSAVVTILGTVRAGEVHTAISLLPFSFMILVSLPWVTPRRAAVLLLPVVLAFIPAPPEWYTFKRLLPVVAIPAYYLVTAFMESRALRVGRPGPLETR